MSRARVITLQLHHSMKHHLIISCSSPSTLTNINLHSLKPRNRKERKKASMSTTMSDRSTPHQVQVHTATTHRYEGGATNYPPQRYEGGGVRTLFSSSSSGKGPSTSQILAVLAGVPIGGTLLFLAGLFFVGSLIGLAVVTPLFILFSPVLVPATLTMGLAVAGILTSDACGLMGLMSFSWMMNYIRETQGTVPEQLDSAKRRMADMAGYVGQKTKEVGQDIQTKAQEVKRS